MIGFENLLGIPRMMAVESRKKIINFAIPGIVFLLTYPIYLSLKIHAPNWDELFFLHRAVCMNNAVYTMDFSNGFECLRTLHKSPILAFLLLPFGSINGSVDKVAFAVVGLQLLIWLQIIVLAWQLQLIQLRIFLLVPALAMVFTNQIVINHVGLLFSDILLSLAVTNMAILPFIETRRYSANWITDISRGFVWGLVIGTAILSKATAIYFVCAILPILVVLRYKERGYPALARTLLAFIFVLMPAIIIFSFSLKSIFLHAMSFSFGSGAKYYSDGLSIIDFFFNSFKAAGLAGFMLLITTIVTIFTSLFFKRNILLFAPLLIEVFYFLIVSFGENRDVRFILPFWLGTPIICAATINFAFFQTSLANVVNCRYQIFSMLSILIPGFFALAGIIHSDPQLNLDAVQRAVYMLDLTKKETKQKVVIATDDPTMNVETLLLASQILRNKGIDFDVDTVVYDIINGRSLDSSLMKIGSSDIVVFQFPINNQAPEWANRNIDIFHKFANERSQSSIILEGSNKLEIYSFRKK